MSPSDSSSPEYLPEKNIDQTQTLPHSAANHTTAERKRLCQPPQLGLLAKHAVQCIVAGPVLYYTVYGGNVLNIGINTFRSLTNGITTIIAMFLGSNLTNIAIRHFHASTWATVIEAKEGGDGVTVDELNNLATGGLAMAPFQLFVRRKTKDRKKSRYLWSTNIFIYLFLIGLSKIVSFLLERTFTIDAQITQQPNGPFQNVSVLGDLSPDDMGWAQQFQQAYQAGGQMQMNYIASIFAGTIRANSLQHSYNNQSIFLSEVLPGQLLPNARGPGTFTQGEGAVIPTDLGDTSGTPQKVADTPLGQLVRWPRWGIRVTCQSLPDPTLYLVPLSPSGYTYVYLPNSLIGSLAAALQVSIPPTTPWNSSAVLQGTDTLPAGLDSSTIYSAYAKQPDGASHSGTFFWLDDGTSGQGWKVIDVHLVRINTAIPSNGSFPVTASVNGSQIGYDAAVCLEVIEPWVLQAYNTTGSSPRTTKFFGRGDNVDVGAVNQALYADPSSVLDSSNISSAYQAAVYFARKDMTAESTGFPYTPSPILVDFTGNNGTDGPGAYTKLSPSSMETVIGAWDSSQALPYLIGTGYITAQVRQDRIIATGKVNELYLGLALGLILLVGFIADVCIPRLPDGVPLRDFGMLSAITIARPALHKLDPTKSGDSVAGRELHMPLKELKEEIGAVKAHG
ncbi:hypothetical protein BOTBODRAFT_57228 [Botryobasidium botryosum FD-172 SS1]|uniref:Uncharacterized protein n=1 Tax=Botryobasidium botryosum (strain FD-172 SS1) TaxID=930990 RepID=A0A067M7W0_BOTB1|nr:hypothetical protein BOTBODRAFT_57228 [Botryobasidium botryosum FD-172 SS1]